MNFPDRFRIRNGQFRFQIRFGIEFGIRWICRIQKDAPRGMPTFRTWKGLTVNSTVDAREKLLQASCFRALRYYVVTDDMNIFSFFSFFFSLLQVSAVVVTHTQNKNGIGNSAFYLLKKKEKRRRRRKQGVLLQPIQSPHWKVVYAFFFCVCRILSRHMNGTSAERKNMAFPLKMPCI